MSTTAAMKRLVVTNPKTGYKEVSLEFRKLRAAALEKAQVHLRENRIHCPMLDAARTGGAYGKMALTTCNQAGLDEFAAGIALDSSKLSAIAYMSGPWYKIPSNQWNKQFDDTEVNTGFVKSLKHGVHTGIIAQGKFDQTIFNEFVWNLFPDWKTKTIDQAFIESSQADNVYITSLQLEQIMAFNESKSQDMLKGLGAKVSQFEMEKLLLGRLGQSITLDDGEPQGEEEKKVRGISLRDVHDFYKFGVFPVNIEEGLLERGLIEDWSLAMTGQVSKIPAASTTK